MKANNLSISIPYKGCDKNCPYCVSKMTGYLKSNNELFKTNINKVRQIALTAGVTSVSITGKGEPTLNFNYIKFICQEFKNFPLEIQTNGLSMLKDLTLIDKLSIAGIDIFAISMDKLSDFELFKPVIKKIHELNKTVRVTLNVTDMLLNPKVVGFMDYISYCKLYNIEQFSLRQITSANYTETSKTHTWIKNHVENNNYYQLLIKQFTKELLSFSTDKILQYKFHFLGKLSYGAKLYDVEGVSFTYFDYCIQDSNNGENIRSLIYMEDGHMYTNWSSKASRIF